jgi:hypothetical protein
MESRRADSNRLLAHYEYAVQSATMQGASPFYPLYNLDNFVLCTPLSCSKARKHSPALLVKGEQYRGIISLSCSL